MNQTVAVVCLLLTGCAQSEANRTAACNDEFEAGGIWYSLARTDSWRVGQLPLWSAPAAVRSVLGDPDSVAWADSSDGIHVLSYPWRPTGPIVFETLGDTVAYPTQFELGDDTLTTDRGRFEAGTALSEIREAYPESYRCRDWPFRDQWFGLYDSEWFVDDTTREARVALWFRDGGLAAVGVRGYAARDPQSAP